MHLALINKENKETQLMSMRVHYSALILTHWQFWRIPSTVDTSAVLHIYCSMCWEKAVKTSNNL